MRKPLDVRRLLVFFYILSLSGQSIHALESWADKRLTITNGLELWLDASKEIAARSQTEPKRARTQITPKLIYGGPLDLWHDASGNGHHVRQLVSAARPRFVRTSAGAAVHFDGVDDFMAVTGLDKEMSEATIFILGAPRSNRNIFGAFLALNREGANDYQTGLNVDMANGSKTKFDFLNVEGAGFVGVQNLMTSTVPFGETHVISIIAEAGTNDTRVWIDGVGQDKLGRQPRAAKKSREPSERLQKNGEAAFGFDQVTVGARFFSNSADPAQVQGFLEGDLHEVLIYNHILTETERFEVERYLKQNLVSKYEGRDLALLNTVTNPPPVQMFVPGFAVRQIPVSLPNINGVKYRDDGKLVALGYDGKIWILSDTDGDGIEDKATAFWSRETLRAPIGMALTPPNYPRGRGVFVPSKGKVSLIVDTNGDDVADEEIIVADGWKESSHGVDALGVAVDRDGYVFFGLGTANFTGAYLVDENGKAHYDLKSERGTIMKVSPDFKNREIVCTGIRFPVAMAFNSHGDLFSTDQEGATWLPNGNPFDELLHIERGKHYGFPPRHPKYLPAIIDEPSVFDYAPQHQSTCGLNFNQPVNGGPTFGPAWWGGDAFVSGYSRGKIFRTKLVKTDAGYVAQNQLIAALNLMPVDACVSPQGDLIVAVHSGQPDWGSGPTGAGRLYKISYTDTAAPQPVALWPVSPTETQIEFHRPLDPAQSKTFAKQISITQGRYVSAGDQFETIRPGYQAVQNQLIEPRYTVKVLSTVLSPDGRSLIIRSEPRQEAVKYAITLPRGTGHAKAIELPQQPGIDLGHDLSGVEAEWRETGGPGKSSIWLPHPDLAAARALTKGSAAHETFWSKAVKRGELKIRTQLELWQMLRSATQPDSKLNFEYANETITVVLKSKSPLQVNAPAMKSERLNENEIHLTATPKENVWLRLEIVIQTAGEPVLEVSWFTAEDSRRRALPLRRILLPWATLERSGEEKNTERIIPEISGGNWLNGRKIFSSDQPACYKCHSVGRHGGKMGPDLSNLIQRDYASVLKDITQPSAAINPDYVAYNVELKNGEPLTGILVGSSEIESTFAEASGKTTTLAKARIVSVKPSEISLMPEGLMDGLTEQQRRDLLTYLLMPAPFEPALLERKDEPPPRKWSEVEAILKGDNKASLEKGRPLKMVLCSGPKDHGADEHDYPGWQKRWAKLLALAENVLVETAEKWPTPEQWDKADVVVFYSNNPDWSVGRASVLDRFLNRGGGLVYIHYAIDGHENCEDLAQRIGLAWRGGVSKFRHGPIDLKFQPHPITAGFGETHFVDESYWNLIGSETNMQHLASGVEENHSQPLMWTREQGKGRVFVSVSGHFTWTFDDPLFRLLIFRGMAWSAHEPVNRFNELVTVGAKISE